MKDWQLAEAKNKLSEVVNLALSQGPQRIRRRRDSVFVLSEAEYSKLTKKKYASFGEALLAIPKCEELILERDKSVMRDIDL